MFEIVYDDDGRTDAGYTISSPCEPNGSGELKIHCFHFFPLEMPMLPNLTFCVN